MTNFEKVGLFMKTFGQEVKTHPSLSSTKINDLRTSLIEEELEELKQAIKDKNLSENKRLDKFDLSFLLNAYSDSSEKQNFFNNYFDKLAGTKILKNQIINGVSKEKIIKSWEKKLDIYKEMRVNYLIY